MQAAKRTHFPTIGSVFAPAGRPVAPSPCVIDRETMTRDVPAESRDLATPPLDPRLEHRVEVVGVALAGDQVLPG